MESLIPVIERKGIKRREVIPLVAIGLGIALSEYVFAYQNVAYGVGIALGLVLLIYVLVSVLES